MRTSEMEAQAAHVRRLFAALYDWGVFWERAVELVGDKDFAISLGLDQMGHFGTDGVALVADRLLAAVQGELRSVVELGSGFGGALRHLGRELKSRGLRPRLIGVEFVPEHCKLAATIGQTIGDSEPSILQADVRTLPFGTNSVDAIFAAGSASHFNDMGKVLLECGRVLRPGGVLVMTEEVSLRPQDGPPPQDAFRAHHPDEVFHTATPERRQAELDSAGLNIETFEGLGERVVPQLRQRVRTLRFLGHCTLRMYGAEPAEQIIGSLTAAADEYERGSVSPMLILARRAR
jgi:SAM-dependent methyltransferase